MTDTPEDNELQQHAIDLSVVVVVLVDLDHLQHCLEALEVQDTESRYEVIIPCVESLGEISSMEVRFPYMEFVRIPGERTYAQLRTIGVKRACGRLVAVTEDHCLPEADWIQSIVDEHASTPVAIGGVVEKPGPDKPLNWAVYFLDYLRYMPPVNEGETHELTDLNVSYKMSALQEIADVWQQEFHEPDVHGALGSRGGSLLLSPKIVVRQRRVLGLKHALWDRYAFGRLFGSNRVANVSFGKQLVYAALAPALPVLLIARLTGHIHRKRRRRKEFVLAMPAILLLATAWAYGEFIGYVTRRSDPQLEPAPEPWPDP